MTCKGNRAHIPSGPEHLTVLTHRPDICQQSYLGSHNGARRSCKRDGSIYAPYKPGRIWSEDSDRRKEGAWHGNGTRRKKLLDICEPLRSISAKGAQCLMPVGNSGSPSRPTIGGRRSTAGYAWIRPND